MKKIGNPGARDGRKKKEREGGDVGLNWWKPIRRLAFPGENKKREGEKPPRPTSTLGQKEALLYPSRMLMRPVGAAPLG
jgi:hypothetical protein